MSSSRKRKTERQREKDIYVFFLSFSPVALFVRYVHNSRRKLQMHSEESFERGEEVLLLFFLIESKGPLKEMRKRALSRSYHLRFFLFLVSLYP